MNCVYCNRSNVEKIAVIKNQHGTYFNMECPFCKNSGKSYRWIVEVGVNKLAKEHQA